MLFKWWKRGDLKIWTEHHKWNLWLFLGKLANNGRTLWIDTTVVSHPRCPLLLDKVTNFVSEKYKRNWEKRSVYNFFIEEKTKAIKRLREKFEYTESNVEKEWKLIDEIVSIAIREIVFTSDFTRRAPFVNLFTLVLDHFRFVWKISEKQIEGGLVF